MLIIVSIYHFALFPAAVWGLDIENESKYRYTTSKQRPGVDLKNTPLLFEWWTK